jgi:hypothetical protein
VSRPPWFRSSLLKVDESRFGVFCGTGLVVGGRTGLLLNLARQGTNTALSLLVDREQQNHKHILLSIARFVFVLHTFIVVLQDERVNGLSGNIALIYPSSRAGAKRLQSLHEIQDEFTP